MSFSYGSLDALLDDEENIVQYGGGQLIRLHAVQLHSLGHQHPWSFRNFKKVSLAIRDLVVFDDYKAMLTIRIYN